VTSKSTLVEQLRALGVSAGSVLLVHTSFRSVRPVEGGPAGLIEALCVSVGPHGTLVMPSWTGSDEDAFDPRHTPAASDLGVVADTFWRMPGDPLPLPPHIPASPVGRVHDLDGLVLLLGVGHDANTTLHLAEILAAVPYGVPKQCMVERNGQPVRVDYRENDHCCQLFALADEWLRERGLQAEGVVGSAQARLLRARDIVSVAREFLSKDPLVFLHPPQAGCAECDQARMSTA
jgi:aminoglycoside N3'-acetyltransferase